MTHTEALKLALEALEEWAWTAHPRPKTLAAITAIKEALAQPQQEPVACGWWEHTSPVTGIKDVQDWQLTEADKASGWIEQPLYTTPPQRKPLTDEEITEVWRELKSKNEAWSDLDFARAIEAKLKEKNT